MNKIYNLVEVVKILGNEHNFIFESVILFNSKPWMKPDEKSKRNLFEIIENIDLLVDEHIKIINV